MTKNQYELTVCVNSRPIREFGHRGLTYVEGRKGHRYTIKFRNNTAQRVLAVFSVDGSCVLDAKPATNDSRGYVIPAYQSIEVKGWRTSLEESHKFVFDHKKKSVSAQKQSGDQANCGIVEVKVFAEKNPPITLSSFYTPPVEHHHHHHHTTIVERPSPFWGTPMWCGGSSLGAVGNSGPAGCEGVSYSCSINNSAGLKGEVKCMAASNLCPPADEPVSINFVQVAEAMQAAAPKQETPDFNLGTGWGEAQEDKVDEVKFERGYELADLAIYYSDAAGLKAAGIEVDKKPAVSKPALPKGFNGFCTPPVVTST